MSVRQWTLPFELDALQSPEDWAMAAHCMNREIEQLILGAPEDYLWTYNRYRRPRPELVEPTVAAAE
jgi:lauroyl/myristoyl acyltransferase